MLNLGGLLGRMRRRWARRHAEMKCFERALRAAGGLTGRYDSGLRTVPTERIVGSVSRWQNLRPDFCYRTGPAMTSRYYRIGDAMRAGTVLPPLELYELRERRPASPPGDEGEFYVVDGHHRVAMARRLGQDFLDAHVVVYHIAAAVGDAIATVDSA